jgi:simple sugar transport system substrate-binding protein
VVHEWGGFYTRTARAVLDGRWTPRPVWGGIADGFIRLAPFAAAVSEETAQLVRRREREIVAGRLRPFGSMSDAQILAMNRFVPGVVGTLPRP